MEQSMLVLMIMVDSHFMVPGYNFSIKAAEKAMLGRFSSYLQFRLGFTNHLTSSLTKSR